MVLGGAPAIDTQKKQCCMIGSWERLGESGVIQIRLEEVMMNDLWRDCGDPVTLPLISCSKFSCRRGPFHDCLSSSRENLQIDDKKYHFEIFAKVPVPNVKLTFCFVAFDVS